MSGDTMPEIFTYPASPHLAARLDGRPVDFAKIEAAGQRLAERYDAVLVEGAGGLMVPLTDDMLTIDYVAEKDLPLILVTSGRLGSINHTLLSLEAIQSRGLRLEILAYNLYPETDDKIIRDDTRGICAVTCPALPAYADNRHPQNIKGTTETKKAGKLMKSLAALRSARET